MDALKGLEAMRNPGPAAEVPKPVTQAEVLQVLDREIAAAGGPRWEPVQDPRPSRLCVPPPRVWVVGENNPYQRDLEEGLRYAMYPDPAKSAGARFCFRILGMQEREYLRAFERRNLLARPTWSAPLARGAAACLSWEFSADERVVLLGARVWKAFFPSKHDPPCRPFERARRIFWVGARRWEYDFLALPHPSGLNQVWNGKDPRWPRPLALAREAVRQLAPELVPVLATDERTWERTPAETSSRRGT